MTGCISLQVLFLFQKQRPLKGTHGFSEVSTEIRLKKRESKMKKSTRMAIVVSIVIIGISAILLSNALAADPPRARRGVQSDPELEKAPVPKDNNEKKIQWQKRNSNYSNEY